MKVISFLFTCLCSSASLIFAPVEVFADIRVDTLFTDAIVYGHPQADTVGTKDGEISFIGNFNASKSVSDAKTEIIDLDGAALYPGFVDNHNHVFEAASDAGGSCEVSAEATLEEQVPFLKICRQNAKPGRWVIGYGHYLESILSDEDTRTPLDVLDSIFPDQPVVIMEQTSHSMWVNSKALADVGFTARTKDPLGGVILKEDGLMLGILLDNAGDLVMEKAWNALEGKFNQSYDGLVKGLQAVAANGITTVGDGRLYWKRGWYDVWNDAEKDGNITARVSIRPWVYPEGSKRQQLDFFKKIRRDDQEDLLVINQVKMYSDGLLENGTAKVLQPYFETIIPQYTHGINYIPQQDMQWWLTELNSIGYGAHIHTIGDGGVHESLNAIAAARSGGSQQNYTLTHVEFVNQPDLARFKSLGVTADFQLGSDHVLHAKNPTALRMLGNNPQRHAIPVSKLHKQGANISLSSDWNVNPLSPLAAIANAVSMDKRGLPSVTAAIDAYTINPAKSLGLDEVTGSIALGKSADFVVLSKDIAKLQPRDIKKTEVLMTILQGDIVYDSEK